MIDKYILDGKIPIPEPDLEKFGRWYETADRIVAQDTIDGMLVSTVFLGINHSWNLSKLELFETMIFDEDRNSMGYLSRYATWDEALNGHYTLVGYLLTLDPKNIN